MARRSSFSTPKKSVNWDDFLKDPDILATEEEIVDKQEIEELEKKAMAKELPIAKDVRECIKALDLSTQSLIRLEELDHGACFNFRQFSDHYIFYFEDGYEMRKEK